MELQWKLLNSTRRQITMNEPPFAYVYALAALGRPRKVTLLHVTYNTKLFFTKECRYV